MRNEKEPTEFGRYLLDLMSRLGIDAPAEFARRVNVTESTISRWIHRPMSPTPSTLRKAADRLGPGYYDEMMAAAGHLPPASGKPSDMHPVSLEVENLLGPYSSLEPDEREMLATMLDRILAPYRKHAARTVRR